MKLPWSLILNPPPQDRPDFNFVLAFLSLTLPPPTPLSTLLMDFFFLCYHHTSPPRLCPAPLTTSFFSFSPPASTDFCVRVFSLRPPPLLDYLLQSPVSSARFLIRILSRTGFSSNRPSTIFYSGGHGFSGSPRLDYSPFGAMQTFWDVISFQFLLPRKAAGSTPVENAGNRASP